MKAFGVHRVAGMLAALALGAGATVARAEVEFVGYVQAASGARFVLADAAAGKASDLLEVGGVFAEYKVAGFDAKTETLTVEKGGVATRLRLKAAAVVAGAVTGGEAGLDNEAALAARVEEGRKELARIDTERNELIRKLQTMANDQAGAQAVMAAMSSSGRRNALAELVQLESDLILFIQMRREQDENAVKTRARVVVLRRELYPGRP